MALTLFQQPAIARLEESLDQMFLRDPGDYCNVLRVGREAATTIDLDDLLNGAARTMTDAALLLRSSYRGRAHARRSGLAARALAIR